MLWAGWFCTLAVAGGFVVDAGRGPVRVDLPEALPGEEGYPLVIALHGYGNDGAYLNRYFGLAPLVDTWGFAYTYPDGVEDLFGWRNWNATDYCCNFFGDRDDVGYLLDLRAAIEAEIPVDPKRVWFIGHSNGGFMSYRMACEDADRIAGLVSLAGATWEDRSACAPTSPVHVLQVHGTRDETILFDGDCPLGTCYPGVKETLTDWSTYNGCAPEPIAVGELDLDAAVDGAETRQIQVERCAEGGSVALWRMSRSGHIPDLTPAFAEEVVRWLFAHPKP